MKAHRFLVAIVTILCIGKVQAAVLEEIVVTATKREESLLDVPVAVSVMDGVLLDRQSIGDLEELTLRMPSVMMSEAQAATNIYIRGVGSGQNFGFEQSVGMFIDSAYFSKSRSFRNPFFDVERVEVLKGPQTVLFGKNVVAGAFNITTRKPTREWERTLIGYYEPEYDGKRFTGIISGPISDTLGIRIAGEYFDTDGYLKNSFPGAPDPGTRDEYIVRTTLLWEPTENFTVTLKGEVSEYDTLGGYATQPILLSARHLALTQQVDPKAEANKDYKVSVPGTDKGLYPTDLFQDTNTQNVTLTLDWDVAEHRITSISSAVAFDYVDLTNNDHTNLNVVAGPQRQDYLSLAQELRITSPQGQFLEYIAGAYYSDDRYRTRLQASLDLSQSFIAGIFASDRLGRNQHFSQNGETWAIFGEVKLNFTDDLRLKLGARYTEDRKEVHKRLWYSDVTPLDEAVRDPVIAASYNGVIGVEHDLDGIKRKTDDVPFDITGEWDVTDDLMAYASYKEGFKAGGFDEDFTSGVLEDFEFEDEGVKAYAFGGKWKLAGGAAYINAEYFHSRFTNLQVSTFSVASFLVGNAASAISQGVDIDARWQVNDNLNVGGAFVWLDADYDEYETAPCTLDDAGNPTAQFCDLSGQPLQYAPDVELNVFGDYTWQLMNGWDMVIGGDLTYSDDFFLAGDNDPVAKQGSFVKINAFLTLASQDGKYRLSVLGKNLTDKITSHETNDIPLAGLYGGKGVNAFVDPPRTVAIQGEIRF